MIELPRDLYIEKALESQKIVIDAFPPYPVPPAVAEIVDDHGATEVLPPMARPYKLHSDFSILDAKESNLRFLSQAAHEGQMVAVQRHIAVRGESHPIVMPGLLCGGVRDELGREGARVLLLNGQSLNPLDPKITFRQETIARTFGVLSTPETGDASADTVRVDGRLATPLEPGHRYMALRALTDMRLLQLIQAGKHPVHLWRHRGIAETVAADSISGPGMYDMAAPMGTSNRRVFPERRNIYPGDDCEVIMHAEYSKVWNAEAAGGLAPEDVGAAMAILAARSSIEFTESIALDRMLSALQAINNGAQ